MSGSCASRRRCCRRCARFWELRIAGQRWRRGGDYRRGSDELEAQARAGVVEALGRVPGVRRASRVIPARGRKAVYQWIGRLPSVARRRAALEPPAMREETRQELRAYFRPHDDRLAAFLGGPLAWQEQAAGA